nr:arylacetamide deacetylase-like 3 [Globicephala melas]
MSKAAQLPLQHFRSRGGSRRGLWRQRTDLFGCARRRSPRRAAAAAAAAPGAHASRNTSGEPSVPLLRAQHPQPAPRAQLNRRVGLAAQHGFPPGAGARVLALAAGGRGLRREVAQANSVVHWPVSLCLLTSYEVLLLTAPHITLLRCNNLNPATLLTSVTEEITHKCLMLMDHILTPCGDLQEASVETHHGLRSHFCKESDSVVLAVGFRKILKHRFPVIVRDFMVATIHFLKSLNTYGADPAWVMVCGDSVGGGVATIVCQNLVDSSDLPKIRAQILIYAALQALDFQPPSHQQNKDVPLLRQNLAFYRWCGYLDISPSWKRTVLEGAHLPAEVWEKYRKWLGSENILEKFKKRGYTPHEPLNETAYLETNIILDLMNSPLIADDEVVSQLRKACIVSCEYDILQDHSLLYKKRLEDLGVPVTWHHMEDGFHRVSVTLDLGCLYLPCSTRILNAAVHFIKEL